ncbi:MAG: hypothetical protein E4H36_03130 [Spirochaetales bacterium]|nr:MAG: hypothetical protein E4H36_03130 [Spirochaetales bacterium]
MFAGRLGRRKKCKQALAALAKKHGWKHEAAGERSGLGFVTASYKGRDIEINPGDEYALEADIHGSPLYLKTEPPGYPQDGVCRFTTGDEQFDSLFPFRYAEPSLAGRIELSREESRRVLHPLYWFLGRWGKKLGRMKIDWSGAAVHLMPGHQDRLDSGQRYLLAEDLESLLEDMVLLVRAIDDIAAGKESNLPEN